MYVGSPTVTACRPPQQRPVPALSTPSYSPVSPGDSNRTACITHLGTSTAAAEVLFVAADAHDLGRRSNHVMDVFTSIPTTQTTTTKEIRL